MYKLSWEEFKDLVIRKFCPMNEKDEIQIKFLNHRVVGTNLKDYNTKFLEYCRIVPHLVTPENNKVTRYIWGLPKEIRDMVRSSLPQTIDSAMELAGYMMNGLIRTREEERKENVFKKEVAFKRNDRGNKKPYRREKKNSQSLVPLCKICNRRHIGKCKFNQSVTCTNCKQVGHATTDCWKNKIACYGCGEMGHFQNECPKKKTGGEGASGSGTKNEGRKGNACVFVHNTEKAAEMPEVITGTFLVNNVYARVLFDSGANQSFIDKKFCDLLNEPLVKLDKSLIVETTDGFDIVLVMDWLSDNQARILCDKKAIEICTNGKTIQIAGDKDAGHVSLISMIKANNCLRKGCLAFMVYVTEGPKEKKLEDVPIVLEFSDVFPEELPGIPPERDVEFRIDLVPGTAPIAKSPYRLAPTEMKELKNQLDKLLEIGFIRPRKANLVADTLSRKEHEKPKRVRALRLELQIDLIKQIKEAQKKAIKENQISEEKRNGTIDSLVKGDDDILRLGNRIWVPKIDDLRERIMSEAHQSKSGIKIRQLSVRHIDYKVNTLNLFIV
ncbi:uncharacterized protein LOC143545013 [Bidens hawaiensis]|uniref:uncharacterized protein LOC143545013 n=1 Tax=Bidens hawaiensis TaxID=980011 RepID=UPI00404A0185